MPDPVDHALQAAVKALAEVVSPAVDPADALAVDQLRLVVSWLQFHGLRRGDERRLAWAALRLRVALAHDARAVLQKVDLAELPALAAVQTALAAQGAAAEALLGRADAPAEAWRDAAEALDGHVGQAIDALASGPPQASHALAEVVLAHAKDSLMLNRAWFAPFGFEARPDALPPIETLLAGAP